MKKKLYNFWAEYYLFIYSIYRIKTTETKNMTFFLASLMLALNIASIYCILGYFTFGLSGISIIMHNNSPLIVYAPIIAICYFLPLLAIIKYAKFGTKQSERFLLVRKVQGRNRSRFFTFLYVGFSGVFFLVSIVLIAISSH